jgi:oxygen-independent coproporphyrinogen-3 oxidase
MATACERLPERWREMVVRDGFAFTQTPISDEEAAREHLLMNLRLAEGLDVSAYKARWNIALDDARITSLVEDRLLERDGTIVRATLNGRLVLNSVIAALA